MSNPCCLISQIAVTFDEGDRAGAKRETGPVREGVWVLFCFFQYLFIYFLLMYTVQIRLYPPLPNKSFFKYELCCLQQFSASRHHPLSGYTASVHLTVPPLLSALRTHDGMHHPPTSYSWVENACCRMLHAQAYTCVYN